jgi:4-amino-4-deoxy-L-arabinose transferase-like glycosyltransferase
MNTDQENKGQEPGPTLPSSRSLHLCLSVFICGSIFLLFFHRLADRDLWSSHEARAAMNADSVLAGDVGLPRLFDGRAEMQKPPLYYWLVALIARLRGTEVDAWAVRLPSALSAVGCVIALVWFGRRMERPGAGLLAGVILATAVHFTWLARIGRIDMPLTFAVTVACLAFYPTGSPVPGRKRQFVGYLAVAVAVMLKGPIGAVLPAAIWLLHRILTRPVPLGRRSSFWWGIPFVLIVTLPWYVWVNATTDGEFFRVFVWYHNVERGLGGSTLRSHPWWTYPGYFAGDFLPWTPILVGAVVWFFRTGAWRTDAEARFGLVWFVAILVVLSCASFKRADYLLPAYPGAALFLGCTLMRLAEQWRTYPLRNILLRAAVIALPLFAVVFWCVRVEHGLPMEESFRDYRSFASIIRTRAPAPEPVLFFRTEAHALALHVGRPVTIVVQWEELRSHLVSGQARYVVMAPDSAADWAEHLDGIRLSEVGRNTDPNGRHERPLVLLRAEPE